MYAHWTPDKTISETFDPNGGKLLAQGGHFTKSGIDLSKAYTTKIAADASGNITLNVRNGSTSEAGPFATRAGFTFTGWSTKKDNTGAQLIYSGGEFHFTNTQNEPWSIQSQRNNSLTLKYTGNGPVTWYAQWKSNNHNITLDPAGGTWSGMSNQWRKPLSIKPGKAIGTLPQDGKDIGKPGYKLVGWSTSPDQSNNNKNLMVDGTWVPKSDTTIYAHWKANDNDLTMTVHYNGAGTLDPDDNIQKATVPTDQLPHQFADVATPVVQGYLADKAKVAGMKADLGNPNPSATVTYRKSGNIVPVDQDGNPIPGASKPYKTDPSDPTKIVPDQPLPDVPGYKPADGSKSVHPTDPTKDTQVTYKHIAKIQDLPSAGSAVAWLVAIPLLGLVAGAVALALRKKA